MCGERAQSISRQESPMTERESMPCDVVIVGGGPAGLAAAIRLKQINAELEVIVLEKGSEIGAHILSGAVVDPKALDELLPDWREMSCPMAETPVTDNWHWVLSKKGKSSLPHFIMPSFMSNHGCYTGSLGNLTRWLAEQAEGLGVMVFPGFPAADVIIDDEGRTWASLRMAATRVITPPAWKSTPSILCLPRAHAGI
jgi:electron-transferring-flavoprotein dehydrogenase